LVELFSKSPAEAKTLVQRIESDGSEFALHDEPYITAFELACGDQALSAKRYTRDRPQALALWERAKLLERRESSLKAKIKKGATPPNRAMIDAWLQKGGKYSVKGSTKFKSTVQVKARAESPAFTAARKAVGVSKV